MNEPICVVSCVWQRPERLRYTLEQLSRQTHQGFVAWFIINNSAIRNEAEELIAQYPFTHSICHNSNRGPYARLEVMHQLRKDYQWFMTIDDDLIFGESLLADWWLRRNPNAVQGWKGWKFAGDYWQRNRVADGEPCHYLLGSNLMIPARAVQGYRLLYLPEKYWQCDDLWLCYWANHECGMDLMQETMMVSINIDNKDTYRNQHEVKIECLDMLRDKGWAV